MFRDLPEGEELDFDTADKMPRGARMLERKSDRVRPRVPGNRTDVIFDDCSDVRHLVDRCIKNRGDE